NQARIAALSAAPPLGAAPWAGVTALDPLASDAAKAQHDAFVAALGEAWRQEDGRGRVAHAYAYASILGTLARTEQTATLARALVKAGNLPAATRARVATCLVRFHLKDPASTGDLLMSGDAGVRAAVLARLRAHEGGWSGSGRKHVAAVLERLLARADVRRRRDGAWGLGVLKAGAYAAPLAARLADENGDVRHAAAWALTQLKRSPATVAPLKKHAKALLASPKPADLGEGIWLAQWVLGQPQNTAWIDLSNAQLRRVAQRLRPRLDG
ncbi:MAG: hypothetical protein P1V36_17535, partial [Planctomycetota bacterium]|nr:hypothetical protein [Planctomycetota bacterium]